MVQEATAAVAHHHGRVIDPPTGRAAAAQCHDVTVGYIEGAPILTGLSLEVPRTGLVRLHGPNGAGKTTIVEVLSGYLKPWSGRVTIIGEDAGSEAARRNRRVVRTAPALFEYMTVHDHLAVFAKTSETPLAVLLDRASALGLDEWLDANAGGLSSGTAKKLWYVLCTAGDPALIVLDEPFNAVDTDGVAVMVDELRGWAKQGRAVLVVCHTLPPGLEFDHTLSVTQAVVSA